MSQSNLTRPSFYVVTIIVGIVLSLVAALAQAQDQEQDKGHPKVNINAATAEQLQYLPGIGPSKADNIIYAREQGVKFAAPSDLLQIYGIGEKTVEKLADYVIFEGETTATEKIGGKEKTAGGGKYRRPVDDDS